MCNDLENLCGAIQGKLKPSWAYQKYSKINTHQRDSSYPNPEIEWACSEILPTAKFRSEIGLLSGHFLGQRNALLPWFQLNHTEWSSSTPKLKDTPWHAEIRTTDPGMLIKGKTVLHVDNKRSVTKENSKELVSNRLSSP